MRSVVILALLLTCSMLLSRLAAGPLEQARTTLEIVSNDGSYVVEYSCVPSEIPLNERFGLRVRVMELGDPDARIAKNVELAVDARMPHHRHGMRVEPSVTRVEAGLFEVEGLMFHMPGRWELYFDLTEGAITERAQGVVELE